MFPFFAMIVSRCLCRVCDCFLKGFQGLFCGCCGLLYHHFKFPMIGNSGFTF